MSSREGRKPPPNIDGMVTLKVDNIPSRVSKESLEDLFKKYGDVGDVYIPRFHNSYDARGFAFIRYLNRADAEDAQRALDGENFEGRILRIQEAKEKRAENPKEYFEKR